MKKLSILLMSVVALSLTGCSELADWVTVLDRLEDLEGRVETLEEQCNQTNTNIEALQTLVTAMQSHDSITAITPIKEGDTIVGYTITFTNADPITIYNGTNGTNGTNGEDGEDGYTPVIGVKQDTDGNYYWTLDGEWLLDDAGNKIKANGTDGKDGQDGKDGEDGKDGQDGKDGEDGTTPFLKIENGAWWISFDEGLTWTKLGETNNNSGNVGSETPGEGTTDNGGEGYTPTIGVARFSDGILYWTVDGEWILDENGNKIKAEGQDGEDGKDGENGKDGITPELKIENGFWYVSYDGGSTWKQLGEAAGDGTTSGGDSLFASVTWDEDYAYFTLSDGTVLTIPLNKQGGNDGGDDNTGNEDGGDDNTGDDDDDQDLVLPPNNQIWYTTTDSLAVTTSATWAAIISSNVYENGKGVITFSDDIYNIPAEAFKSKKNLKTITLPETILSIGNYAFYQNSALTTINIPSSCLSIGNYAFEDATSLREIIIPDGLITIGDCAFRRCKNMSTVSIPQSVTSIGSSAFVSCSGHLILNCDTADKSTNSGAFYEADFNRVTFGESVTKIGSYAFQDCTYLTLIDIPDNVTIIGSYAFYFCSNLTRVNIGSGITSIGSSAFGYTNVSVIYIKATTPPTISTGSYPSIPSTCARIYVPTNSVETYKAAEGWKNYASKIVGYDFGTTETEGEE